MYINNIIQIKKDRYKVLTDEGIAFVLYKGDLLKFNIISNMEIDDKTYNEIQDMLYKRGKERILYLLDTRDYSSYEIYNKLLDNGYTRDVALKVRDEMVNKGFVNDEEYVKRYIRKHIENKPKNKVILELKNKSIPDDIISFGFESMDKNLIESKAIEGINKILLKKNYSKDDFSYEEREKLKGYLYRKGYDMDLINRCM